MGTVIEACAIAMPGPAAAGAVQLADAAARTCLQRGGRSPDDVQLLVNAGIYLDRNIQEPAIAAMIQEDIGANPQPEPGVRQGTFSFDVRNGGCGLLTGIELVHGLLASRTIEVGLVVATDADPEPGRTEGFGFPDLGGAVLLTADAGRPGFTGFRFATFPEYGDLFTSAVTWRAEDGGGRNVLTVRIADDYPARALECAEATARDLAAAQGLELREVDLLVGAASTPGFAEALAERLGLAAAQAVGPPDGLGWAHTAALPAALDATQLPDGGTALLVSVGSGITVAAAVYRS